MIRFGPIIAAKVFYAIGHYDAIGFSPFSIESTEKPTEEHIAKSYDVLAQLGPIVLAHGGKGVMNGMLFDKKNAVDTIRLGIVWSDESKYVDGKRVTGRQLNGDQSHQGRHIRISAGNYVKLYRYN